MDPEDFESFSDESMLGFDLDEERYKPVQDFADKSIGAMILELASLNFVLFTLEQGMNFSKNSQLDSGKTQQMYIIYQKECIDVFFVWIENLQMIWLILFGQHYWIPLLTKFTA